MKILVDIFVEDMHETVIIDKYDNVDYDDIIERTAKDMITYYGERNVIYGVNNYYDYAVYKIKEQYQNLSNNRLRQTTGIKGDMLYRKKQVALVKNKANIVVTDGGKKIALPANGKVSVEGLNTEKGSLQVTFEKVGTIDSPIGYFVASENESSFSPDGADFLEMYLNKNWEKFINLVLSGENFYSEVEYHYLVRLYPSGVIVGKVAKEEDIEILDEFLD